MSSFVLRFQDIDKTMQTVIWISLVGGKGINLVELARIEGSRYRMVFVFY